MRFKAVTLAALVACAATPLMAQTISDSSAFIKAVRESDGTKATALLAAAGSTVAKSKDSGTGETALHIVVKRRDTTWTSFLLGRGVDPNTPEKTGDTPLGVAARLGFLEGARLLIARGAKVDGGNARGETALIIAVQGSRLDMVQLLVRSGANPDKTDSAAGYSARDYARQDRRNAPILRVLEARPPAVGRKPAGPAIASPQ